MKSERRSHESNLDRLIATQPSLEQILLASPFDSNANIDRAINEEIFFDHFFVRSRRIDELVGKLDDFVTGTAYVRFLDGFSGSGKTTALKYYLRRRRELIPVPIDFHQLPRNVERGDSLALGGRPRLNKALNLLKEELDRGHFDPRENLRRVRGLIEAEQKRQNPIVAVLKSYLCGRSNEDLGTCVRFIHEKQRFLAPYLSERMIRAFNEVKDPVNEVHLLLSEANFGDTFTLFFLYLFLITDEDRLKLIIFDNLDAVEMDYLSDYFQEGFGHALTQATLLAQDSRIFAQPIPVTRRYKFIFCLRDANGAVLNAHIADSLGDPRGLSLHIRFDGRLYRAMLARRLDFYNTYIAKNASERFRAPQGLLDILAGMAEDKYFRRVWIPLFNSDYRKLARSLLYVAEMCGSFQKLVFRGVGVGERAHEVEEYGRRGAVLHGIIRFLKEENFLMDYPFMDIKIDPEEGYCLHSRLILNYLLNRSGLRRSGNIKKPDPGFQPVSLAEILSYFEGIYPWQEVAETLAKAFLFHDRNWVHLVTVRNQPVASAEAFAQEIEEELGSGGSGNVGGDRWDNLEHVKVTLNPGGFVFLKNILHHFEFYAILSGSDRPLFACGLDRVRGRGRAEKFQYKEVIDRVLKLARRHALSMTRFYERKFQVGKRWEPSTFRRSHLSFKYSDAGSPKRSGQFHVLRVLTSHVNYIDRYRRFGLMKLLEADLGGLCTDFNYCMLQYIERYARLLDETGDETAGSFTSGYRRRIARIREKDFPDPEEEVSV